MMSIASLFRPTVRSSNAKPEVIGYSKIPVDVNYSEWGSFKYDGEKDMKVLRKRAEGAVKYWNNGNPRVEMQTHIFGYPFSIIDNGKLIDNEKAYKGNVIFRTLSYHEGGYHAGNVTLTYNDDYNDGRGQGGSGGTIIDKVTDVRIDGGYLVISGINGKNPVSYRYLIQDHEDTQRFVFPIPKKKEKGREDEEDDEEEEPVVEKPKKEAPKKAPKPKVFKEYQQIQLQAFKSDAQYAAEFWSGERLMDETITIQRTLDKAIVSGFNREDRGIRNAIFLDWDKGADKVRLMFVSGIVDPGLSPKVDTASHPMMSKVTDIKIERNRLVVYGPDEYGSPIAYSFAIVKDPKPTAVPETKPVTVKKKPFKIAAVRGREPQNFMRDERMRLIEWMGEDAVQARDDERLKVMKLKYGTQFIGPIAGVWYAFGPYASEFSQKWEEIGRITNELLAKEDKPKAPKPAPSKGVVVFEVRQGKKVLAEFPTKEEAIEYGTQEAQKGKAVCVIGVFR